MLILTRKLGESIVIGPVGPGGEMVRVDLLRIGEGQVRLGLEGPRSVPILRAELLPAEPCQEAEPAEPPEPADVLRRLYRSNQRQAAVSVLLAKNLGGKNRASRYHAGYDLALRHAAESLGITLDDSHPIRREHPDT